MDEIKGFRITRGIVILFTLILVAIISFIIIIIPKKSSVSFTTTDFKKLESRMEEESKQYILQKNIKVDTNEEKKISLEELISAQAVLQTKVTDECNGYVLVKNTDSAFTSKAYLNCGKYYLTDGY